MKNSSTFASNYDNSDSCSLNSSSLQNEIDKKNDMNDQTIDNYLKNHRTITIKIFEKYGYYGQNCANTTDWSFFPSLLFTFTIISTVGYGYMVPLTWQGQIVSICFATIGIPMYLLCLTNITGSFASAFRTYYSKITIFDRFKLYLKKKKQKRQQLKEARLQDNKETTLDSSFQKESTFDRIESFEMTTANTDEGIEYEYVEEIVEEDSDRSSDDSESSEESFEIIDDDEVPVFVAVFIILFYIIIGSFMFKQFEGWMLTSGIYFVCITLFSVGLGDLVKIRLKEF
jgi:hypothetical protein